MAGPTQPSHPLRDDTRPLRLGQSPIPNYNPGVGMSEVGTPGCEKGLTKVTLDSPLSIVAPCK